ncbi:MAG: gluconate permease [Bacteroidota bacterium]
MFEVAPLAILLIGILTVIGMIVVLRVNAFFALITAAFVVSLLAPGAATEKIARVATAFGSTTGSIGIVIAMAAVIGMAMTASGAADRVVQALLNLLGIKRGATALMASGYTLAIPVFFDTVFYLLIPLARSMHSKTGKHYLKYLMAVAGGAAVAHSVVPPTPGPLVIAANLGVDVGLMMLVALAVALPAAFAGLAYATWLDARMPRVPSIAADVDQPEPPAAAGNLPSLGAALLPIVLPVLLIAANTILSSMAPESGAVAIMSVIGNPNLALSLSAALALWVYLRQRRPSRDDLSQAIEGALMSGGIIILITAAGGAFGAMLKAAEIGPAIQDLFAGQAPSGFGMLFLSFFIAALLKFAQGSSTVAMITTSAMLAAMVVPETLGFHPVYLATTIGGGALVGSWMNDSGFWIFTKMGGLTEVDALKSWTPLLAILGTVSMLVSVLLALVFPMV